MDDTSLKNGLLGINADIADALRRAKQIPVLSGDSLAGWEDTCDACEGRLSEDRLRMAVIGTIKSGKSTFINALFSGDFLKRGAGVITSIVTKVRRSDRLRAILSFKSWPEINEEIQRALGLFPSENWRTTEEPFDILRESDRKALADALNSLDEKHFLTNDTRNVNSVLLTAYLKGFPRVKDVVGPESKSIVFEGDRFSEHKAYASDENLAVYLKDIHLEIDSGDIETNIEIADCQGSDSPNPLHLIMIQEYLLVADLVVYVVSSRTGLRQADINFLSMIKKMGIIEHVMFVVNCDFNEHDSIADLRRIISKVREDLTLMTPLPEIYTLSALFALFAAMEETLPEKDRMRLAQWRADAELVEFCQAEKRRFEQDFRRLITEQRYAVLLRNCLERLKTVIIDFKRWLKMNHEIFSADSAGADSLIKRIRQQQKKTDRIKSMIESTLNGGAQQIKREIRTAVDRFFDPRHGEMVPGIMEFVKNYSAGYEQFIKDAGESGFSGILASVFQAFKQDLDRYMAETVNPVLFRFVKEKELNIKEFFESLIRPYEVMVTDTLSEYQAAAESAPSEAKEAPTSETIDIDAVKKSNHLEFPKASAMLDYTATIKTEAFMKLGYYRFISTMKRLMKKKDPSHSGELAALKSGIARMKKETETSVIFHFKNYRENTKFQYMFKLIDGVSKTVYEKLVHRFQAYSTDLSRITEMVDHNQSDKSRTLELITQLQTQLADVEDRIDRMRVSVEKGGYKDDG